MKPSENLRECLKACKEFKFNSDITAEMCWNMGYQLGRKRWYWGPSWFVGFRGFVNTQIDKLRDHSTITKPQ